MRSTWMVATGLLAVAVLSPVSWLATSAAAAMPVAPRERLLLGGDAGPAAMEGDGSGLRPVTAVGITSASGRLQALDRSFEGNITVSFGNGSCPRRIDTSDVSRAYPRAFSPDEATLAVSTHEILGSKYPQDYKVELVNVATGGRTVLASGRDPAWSPDGSSLVYNSNLGFLSPPGTLHTIRRDGTGTRDLGVDGDSAVWSPDGTPLAYERVGSVWILDLATGVERQVTSPTSAFTLRWTGDGSGLYFDVINTVADNGIWVVGVGGGTPRRLATGNRQLIDVVRRPGARDGTRYQTVTSTGVVRTFGPGCGPAGWATPPSGTGVVGGAATADGLGAWTVTGAGRVAATGQAGTLGDMAGRPLQRPVVGMAGSPSTRGYLLVAGDGGIFGFGDARFYGSTGGMRLNRPVVGMASTPSGNGYWLVASDGGIFAYGDAPFHGSTGGITLNRPVVGMASTPSGNGYWLVASDGGIFAYGDAPFHGSTGGMRLNRPVVGMLATPTGSGYALAAEDGGIFPFGDAPFFGSGVGATGGGRTVAVVG